jgi:hypothetical protein
MQPKAYILRLKLMMLGCEGGLNKCFRPTEPKVGRSASSDWFLQSYSKCCCHDLENT